MIITDIMEVWMDYWVLFNILYKLYLLAFPQENYSYLLKQDCPLYIFFILYLLFSLSHSLIFLAFHSALKN